MDEDYIFDMIDEFYKYQLGDYKKLHSIQNKVAVHSKLKEKELNYFKEILREFDDIKRRERETKLGWIEQFEEYNVGDKERWDSIKTKLQNKEDLEQDDLSYIRYYIDMLRSGNISRSKEEKAEVEKLREELNYLNEKMRKTQQREKEIKFREQHYKSESTTIALALGLGFIGILGAGYFYLNKKFEGVGVLITGFVMIYFGFTTHNYILAVYVIVWIIQIFTSLSSCKEYNRHWKEFGRSPDF